MKKTFCYIIMMATLLAACSLDEHPRDQIPQEKAYTNKEALYRNAVAMLYSYIGGNSDGQGLQGTCRGVYDLQTFGSDEAMLPTRGTDWYDGGIWQDMYKHSWTAGHPIPKNAWLYLYEVITMCNNSLNVLAQHKEMAGDDYTSWQAEVRALRAMYYWYLIDLFGDVPLVTSNDVSMNEVTRTPRADVFNFCVNELEDVLFDLVDDNSVFEGDYYGRITVPVAMFVLAKLMLNSEVYTGSFNPEYMQNCINYCDAIEDRPFRLEFLYGDNFTVTNHSSSENIFVIPMDKDRYSNQMQNLFRSYHYRHAAAYGFVGENGTCATLRALQMYGYDTDDEDPRFELNYYAGAVCDLGGDIITDRIGDPLIYYPDKVELDLSDSPYLETAGARMRKYEVDKNAPLDGKLMDNDIVLFRFADVLLMRAEAKVRLGISGQEDLDEVRDRVGLEPIDCTLENLQAERFKEFAWEGWRRQDMIRFGCYKSLYEGEDAVDESDGHTSVFPIPADVRTLNPKLTQNTGY